MDVSQPDRSPKRNMSGMMPCNAGVIWKWQV